MSSFQGRFCGNGLLVCYTLGLLQLTAMFDKDAFRRQEQVICIQQKYSVGKKTDFIGWKP
jgi:hypothetical protein